MTDIVVDIRNVASVVNPDDRVYIWAPHLRERTGGGLTSTAPHEEPLIDGHATITDVDPGPVMVRFECMGISDTSDKQGIVPDAGPVSIFEVLKNDLTWTPAIVDHGLEQIETARDEAVAQVDARFDDAVAGFFPISSASAGMGLVWTGTGFRWSWMDRYVDVYSDQY